MDPKNQLVFSSCHKQTKRIIYFNSYYNAPKKRIKFFQPDLFDFENSSISPSLFDRKTIALSLKTQNENQSHQKGLIKTKEYSLDKSDPKTSTSIVYKSLPVSQMDGPNLLSKSKSLIPVVQLQKQCTPEKLSSSTEFSTSTTISILNKLKPNILKKESKSKLLLSPNWYNYCFECKVQLKVNEIFETCRANTDCQLMFHKECYIQMIFLTHGTQNIADPNNNLHFNIIFKRLKKEQLEYLDGLQKLNNSYQLCPECLQLSSSMVGLYSDSTQQEDYDSNILRTKTIKYHTYSSSEILDRMTESFINKKLSIEDKKDILTDEENCRILQANERSYDIQYNNPTLNQLQLIGFRQNNRNSMRTARTVKMMISNVLRNIPYHSVEQFLFEFKMLVHQQLVEAKGRLNNKKYKILKAYCDYIKRMMYRIYECVECFIFDYKGRHEVKAKFLSTDKALRFSQVCNYPHGLVWAPLKFEGKFYWWFGKVFKAVNIPKKYLKENSDHSQWFFVRFFGNRFSNDRRYFQVNKLFAYSHVPPNQSKIEVVHSYSSLFDEYQKAKNNLNLYLARHKTWFTNKTKENKIYKVSTYIIPNESKPFVPKEHLFLPFHDLGGKNYVIDMFSNESVVCEEDSEKNSESNEALKAIDFETHPKSNGAN